ncbi:MAG: TonB-dependent receptor [Thiobacillaceae bacterium]
MTVLALSAQAAPDRLTETDFLGDVPVVLTASRLSQPLGQTPAAVTIIDRDMIRASGFRDIPDLLRLVPGFTVAYTANNTWGVSYHGMGDAFSRRLQVLIDGRSVYTPGFGEVPWSSLPLSIDDIERMEVVRGPDSATYGSNAFFAVINIITKAPAQVPGAFVSAQYGEQGMAGATLRYGGGQGDLRYRLTLSDQKRDRFASQTNQTDTRILDYRADYQLSSTDEINAELALSRANWRLGVSGDITNPVRDPDVGADHIQLRFHRIIDENTDWSLQFYHTRDTEDDPFTVALPLPIGNFPVNDGYTQWRDDVEFQMTSRVSRTVRLVWGAEARHEGASSPLYFYNLPAQTGSLYRVFGNAEWRLQDRLTLNGALMVEHHYLTGVDYSPRLAVNYQLSPDHALRASISQAYRSPSFFEENGVAPPADPTGYVPSTGLKPEKILSREIGYYGHIPSYKLQIDTRLFNDHVSDLIGTQNVCALDPTFYNCALVTQLFGIASPKVFQPINQNWANIRGADIQIRWKPLDAAEFILNYARVTIDSNDTDIAASTPENNFSGLAIFKLPDNWEASAGVYRQGYMIWLQDGDKTQGYTRVDARLAKRLKLGGHKVELALVGQNLGKDYTEFRKENIFSRRVYASLSLDW